MPRCGKRSRAAATTAVLALVVSACSATGSDTDPSPTATVHRAQCTAADPEGELILHPGSLTVQVPTRLEALTLIAPVNLEIVEESVTAFGGNPGVSGIIRDYPPLKNAGLADSLADWDQRRALPGLTLSPRDGQQAILVALRLVDPTRSGHLVGVILTTDAAGTRRERRLLQPVLVEPPAALCTVGELDSTLTWVPRS